MIGLKFMDCRPFISLGSTNGFSVTSYDKYIEDIEFDQQASVQAPPFDGESFKMRVENLQQEQSKLCEELNAQRRRSECLNATFSRATKLASTQHAEYLNTALSMLQNIDKPTQGVIKGIKYIKEIERLKSSPQSPPRVTDIAQHAKDAEISADRASKELKQVKGQLAQVNSQIETLKSQIEEAQANLETVTNQRQEAKEKLHNFVEGFKKKEAYWKDKVATLEEQLNADAS